MTMMLIQYGRYLLFHWFQSMSLVLIDLVLKLGYLA